MECTESSPPLTTTTITVTASRNASLVTATATTTAIVIDLAIENSNNLNHSPDTNPDPKLTLTLTLRYESGPAPFDTLPTVTNGDGDGTVPLRSARLCESWRRRLGERLQINEVENVTHFDMMRDTAVRTLCGVVRACEILQHIKSKTILNENI